MDRLPIMAVTGLAFEARIAAGPGVNVVCSGDGRQFANSLQCAVEKGCRGIISFGIAGGLSPTLRPGDWVVASAIVCDSERFPTDPHWSQMLLKAHPDAVHGPVAGVNTPVALPSEKVALRAETGAVAVDTESHVAARLAAKHDLPFAAFRVIADAANRRLPAATLNVILADGTADVRAVLRSLARDPIQLPGLIGTALDARRARAALLRSRRLLGPGLGFVDAREHLADVL